MRRAGGESLELFLPVFSLFSMVDLLLADGLSLISFFYDPAAPAGGAAGAPGAAGATGAFVIGLDVNTIAFGAPLSPYSMSSRPPEKLMLVTDASSLKKRSSIGSFAQAILVAA